MGWKQRVLRRLDVICETLLVIEWALCSPGEEGKTMPVDLDALRGKLQSAHDAIGDALDLLDKEVPPRSAAPERDRAAERDARAAAERPAATGADRPPDSGAAGAAPDKTAGRRGGQSAGGK